MRSAVSLHHRWLLLGHIWFKVELNWRRWVLGFDIYRGLVRFYLGPVLTQFATSRYWRTK